MKIKSTGEHSYLYKRPVLPHRITMRVLGINDSHDAGIALFEDGKVIFAVNQERLDRIKLSSGFPLDSIQCLATRYGIHLTGIDAIAIAGEYGPWIKSHTTLKLLQTSQHQSFERKMFTASSKVLAPFYRSKAWTSVMRAVLKVLYSDRRKKLQETLRHLGYTRDIHFIDHHLSHAASAVFSCPQELFNKKTLVITADGAGDGLSGTVYLAKGGKLQKIHEINQYNSLAMVYAYVTQLCGFTPMKHEGKITGLAAFGKPAYLDVLNSLVCYRRGSFYNCAGVQHQAALDYIIKRIGPNFNKADLAASAQLHLEREFTQFVDFWVKKTSVRDVLLAGGIGANVKLNQRINELASVKSIFVHQNMGDGGIAFGAASYLSFQKTNSYVPPPNNVYFGMEFSDSEVKLALKTHRVRYKKSNSIEKEVAKLLAKGAVVARYNGKMEYGPRALGNRTLLYQTTDPTVNDWLNKRLNRTEFMPFAPVTLIEHAPRCYKNMRGGEYTARFMTITFDCTPFMRKKSPAVVHVDGTARPQLIDKATNPSYRKILEEYYKLTGIPSLINTSFNMHEEPIVCSPDDAVRSFLAGGVDYLAIGNYLVKSRPQ